MPYLNVVQFLKFLFLCVAFSPKNDNLPSPIQIFNVWNFGQPYYLCSRIICHQQKKKSIFHLIYGQFKFLKSKFETFELCIAVKLLPKRDNLYTCSLIYSYSFLTWIEIRGWVPKFFQNSNPLQIQFLINVPYKTE